MPIARSTRSLPDGSELRARLLSLVTAFGARRVLVVGDLIADEFIYGDVSRISPEAPAPVIAKINSAVNTRLKTPEMIASLAKLSLEPRPLTPQQFGDVQPVVTAGRIVQSATGNRPVAGYSGQAGQHTQGSAATGGRCLTGTKRPAWRQSSAA